MAGRPSRPEPAQEVDQDGLGLVVGGVAGEHVRREDAEPGGTGPRLEVRAGLDVHALGPKGSTEALGGVRARHRPRRAESGRSP